MFTENSYSETNASGSVSPAAGILSGEFHLTEMDDGASVFAMAVNDTVTARIERTVPTPEQIRYWKIREVNRMFHGEKRELQPMASTSLEYRPDITESLVLPSRPFVAYNQDWLIVVLFLSLVIFASVRHTFGHYIRNLFQSLFNFSSASRMYRERNVSLSQGEIRLEIFGYLIFGIFLFQVSDFYNLNLPYTGFIRFLISLAAVLAFFMLKKLLYLITGYLIEKDQETDEFLYNFSNHVRILGILSLPVVAMIAWTPLASPYPLLAAGLTIFSLLYLILVWRGIRIFLKKQFSIFYLFLYLCTLEILPLLLMLKLVTD